MPTEPTSFLFETTQPSLFLQNPLPLGGVVATLFILWLLLRHVRFYGIR